MRILIAFGDGFDGDAISADFGGDRGQVLGAGDDVELCQRLRIPAAATSNATTSNESLAEIFMRRVSSSYKNGCAPWAPMENWNWNRNSFAVRLSP